jgi:hypothetical protein
MCTCMCPGRRDAGGQVAVGRFKLQEEQHGHGAVVVGKAGAFACC